MSKITDALNNFSQKLSRFQNDEAAEFVKPQSKDSALQSKINLNEEERISGILREFDKYVNPVSKEIEDDELSVLEALNLYKTVYDAASKLSERLVTVRKLTFNSKICSKEEYISGGKRIYLICWLLFCKNENLVPKFCKDENRNRYMEFIPFENISLNYEENAIFGIIQAHYEKN